MKRSVSAISLIISIAIGLLSLLLNGCQGRVPSPTEILPLDIWRVKLSPALGWLAPDLNMCTLKQPNTGIVLVDPIPTNDCFTTADICLFWGEVDYPDAHIFELGSDNLDFIVHSNNPLTELSRDDLLGIISARIESWESLGGAVRGKTGAIQVWVHPSGSDVQNQADKFTGEMKKNPYARIAPSSSQMREAISEAPDAIGYIPHRWLGESVHPIRILDQPADYSSLHVLAVLPTDPQGKMREWLYCLQEAIR